MSSLLSRSVSQARAQDSEVGSVEVGVRPTTVRGRPSYAARPCRLPSRPHDHHSGPGRELHAAGRHHRRGPGRAHRGVRARLQARDHVDDPRGRRRRRRHQPHRRARRLALRHRRPPLLHQGEGGRGLLARDPARRGLHAPPADEPHLLRGQVLRLPAQDPERPEEPGHLGGVPLRRCRTSGRASVRRRTRTRSKVGSRPASGGASTSTSSRPTTRSSGACRPTSSPRTSPPSASRTSRS